MKPTTEGSKNNIEIVCLALEKEERGFKIENAGQKDNIFDENMEITAEKSEILENDTMKTEKGIIVQFSRGSYKKLKAKEEIVEGKEDKIVSISSHPQYEYENEKIVSINKAKDKKEDGRAI